MNTHRNRNHLHVTLPMFILIRQRFLQIKCLQSIFTNCYCLHICLFSSPWISKWHQCRYRHDTPQRRVDHGLWQELGWPGREGHLPAIGFRRRPGRMLLHPWKHRFTRQFHREEFQLHGQRETLTELLFYNPCMGELLWGCSVSHLLRHESG